MMGSYDIHYCDELKIGVRLNVVQVMTAAQRVAVAAVDALFYTC